ncbi:hypothetical protein ACP70R_039985 [Stipagrostis hirtigluma subsp. patula]
MEVETMMEDDVFFAELSKRISLLITDDDDADFGAAAQLIPAAAANAPVPGFASLAHVPQQHGASMLAPPAYTLFHHAASCYGGGGAGSRAAWQQQQQCGSKGTGVFIPRSTPGAPFHRKKSKSKGGNKASRAAAAQAGTTVVAPAKKRAAA